MPTRSSERSVGCRGTLRFGLSLLTAIPLVAIAQNAGDVIPDRYIVRLKPGVDPAAVAIGHGVAGPRVYRAVMNGFAGRIPPGLVRQIAADPNVEAIYPDRVVTLVAGKPGGGGGGGGGSGQVVPEGIVRIGAAPGSLGLTGAGVGVAIVDTGIDFAHRDLTPSPDEYNALDGADPSNAQDDHGHGTHVAGTVAARDNLVDVVGVAPAATPYAVKVLNAQGSGSDSEVIAGLNWVLANAGRVSTAPIRVVNMSLGRPLAPGETAENSVMREPIDALVADHITVVVAAGNDCGLEADAQVPACLPSVITVAATTAETGTSAIAGFAPIAQDSACYFTSDGPAVTISAPGERRENVLKGYRLSSEGILSTKLGGGTVRYAGTSMASPHVAGVVALLYQQAPELTPAEARVAITEGANRRGVAPLDGRTSCYGFDGSREGILWAPGALVH